ncbi:serine hydrolase domain-containing protein [Pseudonocardia sp. TRM90224]|uniref:serine hydrolase domain-containing protein n=1 Tax=Pseudonocardia sp. TRM90224 TaxID=2812678 RepID=UPI001E520487|nr:serine hydrolase domain-containing protein [Pseudonocardia sp. TRM90224]
MKIFRWAAAATVVALGVALAACGMVVDSREGPDQAGLQRDADAVRDVGVTGVQARLITEDGTNIVATSGVGDTTTGAPVDGNGYFRIGSDTKPFVAAVVLQLAGEGALSLDDTVERLLPGVVAGNGNDGNTITVRHLLQHTGGIHDDDPGLDTAQLYLERRFRPYPPAELVARAMSHPPDFAPGTAWAYSNTGYLLLGMIVEKVTDRPWFEEADARILQPLELEHTVWPGDAPGLPEPHARGYQRFAPESPLLDVTELVEANAAHGMVSTTADLNRFYRSLLDGTLVDPAQLAQAQLTVPVSEEVERFWPGGRYGLGLRMRPLSCGGVYWGHSGGVTGFMTEGGVTPDGRRSVIVSMSSALADSLESAERQQQAVDRLVDNALCVG